jgi:hypothetical protein
MMDAVSISETSVSFHENIWRNITKYLFILRSLTFTPRLKASDINISTHGTGDWMGPGANVHLVTKATISVHAGNQTTVHEPTIIHFID